MSKTRIICSTKSVFSYIIKRTYAAQKQVDSRRIFKLYRYAGILDNEAPKMQTVELDVSTCGPMLLDAMIKIKDMDPTYVFRRSCREGICGSCAVCVQGFNRLACITAIPNDKTITIHPIPHMYVIRDLVVDMTHFFEQYNSIRPYLVQKNNREPGPYQLAQSIADNEKTIGLYECVLCACCSTSCPSYWWNGRRFLGPASLLHAYRWIIDSRDADAQRRLNDLRDDFKAFRCHVILNCTLACPKGLNPGVAIAKLKRLITGIDKKPAPEMDPDKFGSGGGGGLAACINKMKRQQLCFATHGSGLRGASIVYDILKIIMTQIKRGKQLRLQWVPAHIGLQRNEEADHISKLALREGTESHFVPDFT